MITTKRNLLLVVGIVATVIASGTLVGCGEKPSSEAEKPDAKSQVQKEGDPKDLGVQTIEPMDPKAARRKAAAGAPKP